MFDLKDTAVFMYNWYKAAIHIYIVACTCEGN